MFSDEKKDQLIFATGDNLNTLQYYAIVEGEFYKLSEGKIVSRSMHSGKNQLWWIEDNGIAKSVNARSNKYNDVYIALAKNGYVGCPFFCLIIICKNIRL